VAAADIAGLMEYLAVDIAEDNICLYSRLIDGASLADKSYAR
jgi:hypothetical protein